LNVEYGDVASSHRTVGGVFVLSKLIRYVACVAW
jgi:hypothetical protein